MNTCPKCNRKLISHISPRCNWCGHEIQDPAYQAQAEVDRAAFFAQQKLHEAQSLSYMHTNMMPGIVGGDLQATGMNVFPRRRPRGMSEAAFAQAAAAQALAQQAAQRAAYEETAAVQAAYNQAAMEQTQRVNNAAYDPNNAAQPRFGTEVHSNGYAQQNYANGSPQPYDPYAQASVDPYAEPERETAPPQPASRFNALEL